MVNKAVYHILKNDSTLQSILGNNIFPVVMEEETKAPCLVFTRDSLTPVYDKSGAVVDENAVSVLMFAKSYTESIEIVDAVRTALELKKGSFNGVQIISSRIEKGDEGFDLESATFWQQLTFQIKTSKI